MNTRNRALLVRELRRAYDETGDRRFKAAVAAINKHYAITRKRRSNRLKWTERQLAFLWVGVQAKKRAFRQSVSTACREMATDKIVFRPGRNISAATLEGAYYRADEYAKADREVFRDWNQKATKLAATLRAGARR